MKILITGGKGYLGKSIHSALKDMFDVVSISRDDFDLTSHEHLKRYLKGKYFDVVIHTAVSGGSRLREEKWSDMDNNLLMYYNLLRHKDHYGKLIHLGSGAEDLYKNTPYGLSKYVIKKSIEKQDNFFNLQIFGLFDENELDSRFIKSNLLRYISRKPMQIHMQKKMDFFYMKDLISLLTYIIKTPSKKLQKQAYCSYLEKYSLMEIADMINNLDEYKVDINIANEQGVDYICNSVTNYGLQYIGLQKGIQEVYLKLKKLNKEQ